MDVIISNSTYYELGLFVILSISLLVQLVYYLFIFIRIPLHKGYAKSDSENHVPVSVVICARNEEKNLENFLPFILEQDYPEFEVVVVNDCSSDDSEFLLDRLSKKYSRLKVTTIKQDEKFSHNKKLALTVGIKSARYDWLLLTDADCKPESNKWIQSVAKHFTDDNEIVLGYGGFFSKSGFLNKLIRFDGLFIAMQYLSYTLINRPYMGVGRNLAYRRSLFFKNKGFATHAHIESGDDDLFINEVATRSNTRVEFCHDSHIRTIARDAFRRWVFQKRRHITTGPKYKGASKLLISGEIISRVLFYGSAIALLSIQYFPLVILSVILFRWMVQLVIIKQVMNRLNERKILLILLIYDISSLFFYGLLATLNRFTVKKSPWR